MVELLCIWDMYGAVYIRKKGRVAIWERIGSYILLVLLGRVWTRGRNSSGGGSWSERQTGPKIPSQNIRKKVPISSLLYCTLSSVFYIKV